ncbi:MAG: putative acetyl esterase [Haloplasmataceae bacterium]|nr:putative acetyl esterase [Haloplasmataceae bacterium]
MITTGKFLHQGSFNNLLGENPSTELLDKMSLEKHINKETPTTFIFHTVEDQSVPVENTLLFVEGLRKNKISFEMHIYPEGRHGLSLAVSETAVEKDQINLHVSSWIKLCIEWLNDLFKK